MRNHYPAIDVLGSVSRLMTDIVSEEQLEIAGQMRDLIAIYDQNYDLINIGAYKSGTNLKLDYAIERIDRINSFLQQKVDEKVDFQDSIEMMKAAIA
jgi:flagellum-specific ATP synthase